jgi:hypothetical protein
MREKQMQYIALIDEITGRSFTYGEYGHLLQFYNDICVAPDPGDWDQQVA